MKRIAQVSNRKQPESLASTLSPVESMKVTGIGLSSTYALLRSGQMPSIRVGKKFFIPRSALMKWLDSCGKRVA